MKIITGNAVPIPYTTQSQRGKAETSIIGIKIQKNIIPLYGQKARENKTQSKNVQRYHFDFNLSLIFSILSHFQKLGSLMKFSIIRAIKISAGHKILSPYPWKILDILKLENQKLIVKIISEYVKIFHKVKKNQCNKVFLMLLYCLEI